MDNTTKLLFAKIVANQLALSAALTSTFMALSRLERHDAAANEQIDELGQTLEVIWKREDELASLLKGAVDAAE